ncbi:hypothetical protein ACEQ38_00400 [Ralstonia syzygii subsp. celebesensis]|uniref:hypothetical protein n=1 Tax=Ralstonia syzygii TaxID=28097 RepID=UPI001E4F1CFC|nr:hypothetical protein [Ralstonia syzygii]
MFRADYRGNIMMRGRVDERNIRASAPPDVQPAPVGPDRAASPPAGGHQAVRSAALANLAKAPTAGPSADGASSLSRRTALPAPDDPGVALNKALKRIDIWRGLLTAGREPGAREWSPEEVVQYAGPVMKSARTGLDALAALKMQLRTTDSYADETENMLLSALAMASNDVLNVRDDMVKERWEQRHAVQAEVAETASGPAEDPEPDFGQLPGWLGDLKQVRAALDEIARRFKSAETSGGGGERSCGGSCRPSASINRFAGQPCRRSTASSF